MKTKLKILNLILLCIFLTSCSSDDDSSGGNNPVNQLPEATQTGENTFGCIYMVKLLSPAVGLTLWIVFISL
jgi:PBP1b-binding outer membrane lipoprotein LpoB